MSLPKRHHFVPRFILANFADSTGRLWVRRVSGGAAWSARPEDVYVERHRYSLVDPAGNRDPELEKAYSLLEAATKPIVDRLLGAARTMRPPSLTGIEKAVWDEFLYHQMKRVPAAIAASEAKEDWASRLEAAISRLRERGVVVDEETLRDLRGPAGLARVKQNATVRALSADSPLVRILLGAANIELGVSPSTSSFVISSHPIAGIRAGLQSAKSGSSEMWLPIASDVAVKVSFGARAQTFALTSDHVASINRDSSTQGDFLAGVSREAVEAAT